MTPLKPSSGSFTVRMYRQGHGDCFLLATPKLTREPFYMLIDCGLWNGSQIDLTIEEVIEDIKAATGGRLDVLLITHEHLDHVSGFLAGTPGGAPGSLWDGFDIGEIWLAWTEDGDDPDANDLRKRFHDTLIGLNALHEKALQLGLDGGTDDRLLLINELVYLQTGDRVGGNVFAATRAQGPSVPGYSNKVAIKGMRDRGRVKFLAPNEGPYTLPGVDPELRVYALGPPRDPKLLLSLDPSGAEEFKFGLDASASLVLDAGRSALDEADRSTPFSPRYGRRPDAIWDDEKAFFLEHYGDPDDKDGPKSWRRIDGDWLDTAEELALRLNDEVNNTSLVVAFELPRSKKVLLFTGDAQRGSWISWSKLSWTVNNIVVTARELLARAVFYKVGHHGSHNATLNGQDTDDYANLEWMAKGRAAEEFTAMIPANKPWAMKKKPRPWLHPLKAIEDRLRVKTQGRLMQMDETQLPTRPDGTHMEIWKKFQARTKLNRSYIQISVEDSWE